jgi:hypothetical protein
MEKHKQIFKIDTRKVTGEILFTACYGSPSHMRAGHAPTQDLIVMESKSLTVNGVFYRMYAECYWIEDGKDSHASFKIQRLARIDYHPCTEAAYKAIREVLEVTATSLLLDKEFTKAGYLAHLENRIASAHISIKGLELEIKHLQSDIEDYQASIDNLS